jgi:peptidoglycan hydrolase CwlO-like protein
MNISDLSAEFVKSLADIAAPFAMFGTVVLILRWFKQDTSDMIKIYSEATDAKIDAIKEDVKAIREDVRAIKDDVRDFHNRLCSIEENRDK